MSVENDGGMILTGENRRTRRKTCPSATLSTTNPIWIDPGTNPGLHGERPASNRLNHGTAYTLYTVCVFVCVRVRVRVRVCVKDRIRFLCSRARAQH
jgi:hypothetical protein